MKLNNFEKLGEFAMIMKKILSLLLIGFGTQHLTASHQRYGAQIGDINGLERHANLVSEIHEVQAQDNLPELLANARAQIFSRHLTHHFKRDEVLEFIKIVEESSPETIELVDNHLKQAVTNFFQSRKAPTVTPQGKSFIGYLTFLRDQNDE